MAERLPGWYWVRWLNGWRPARYHGDQWHIWGVDGLVIRDRLHRIEIGPRLEPPQESTEE